MKRSTNNASGARERFAHLPRQLLAFAVLAVLCVAGVMLWLDRSGGESSANGARNATYAAAAEQVAARVAAALDPYRRAASGIAADARVREALAAADSGRLAALAAALAPALDGTLALRILAAHVRDADLGARPPLTYASISLMRAAREDGKTPRIEAHLAGTDDEHLVVIAPVAAAAETPGAPLGFVHLSVDPDIVRAALRDAPPPTAYVEIRQGSKVRLASSGTAPPADTPSFKVAVGDTAFAVRVAAPGRAAPGADDGPFGLSGGLAALAAVLLGGGLLAWRRRQPAATSAAAAAADVVYQGAIRNILDGAHPGLEQLLPRARAAAPAGAAPLDLPRAHGEDVTRFEPVPVEDEDPTVPGHTAAAPPEDGLIVTETFPVEPVPSSVFRSYDIRGIVGETLTEDGVYQIGRALAAEAESRGQKTVVVARDGRHSSEPFMQALCKGLLESGRDVLDIGLAPTPVLYFATHHLDARSGVMITGSHNPASYNGLKIVLDGETLSGEAIQAIRRRVEEQDFVDGTGSLQSTDILAEYIRRISEEIPVTLGNALRVVVDCGNGVPGAVAPDVLRAIGHDVVELFCDVDGDFPNHHPDPSQPENLQALIDAVQDEGADLGLAFDGDGDRLGVVDAEGNVIWPDRQLILFSRDILSRNPGAKIIYDVKCSRLLAADITEHGGEPIMSRTGHSLIKARMQETGALLAGEMSGHIFFKERWYGFDDAIYSAARLLEIIVNSEQSPADLFAALPGGVATPELHLDMPEEMHAEFMAAIMAAAQFPEAEITTIDGLRVDFADSWGLIRPSNTTPCLVLRFEGDDEAALEGVKARFRALITGIDDSLPLPF